MVPEPGGKVLPVRARTGRRQEARLAHHDGAMARVRQVPGPDQARHSERAAHPPLKPDERQLEGTVGPILATYARQAELAHPERGSVSSPAAILGGGATRARGVILNA